MPPLFRGILRGLEIVTVGFPFCVFKLITGRLLLELGAPMTVGIALMLLGVIDALLNLVSLLFLTAGKRSPVAVCLLQQIIIATRSSSRVWRQLGLSLDALLAFALVAFVIGFGLIPKLPHATLLTWNLAVVFNVLGAGVGRLAETLWALREAPQEA